jgi:tetratricopeptide (TPR) repeat protein
LRSKARRAELLAHLALGEAYLRSGAAEEAEYHFGEAAKVARGTRSNVYGAWALAGGALARVLGGEAEAGVEQAGEAEGEAEKMGARHVLGVALLAQANAQERLGLHEQAGRAASRGLQLAEEMGIPDVALRSAHLLGHIAAQRGKKRQAREHFRRALEAANGMREGLAGMREDGAFLADRERACLYKDQEA